MRKPPRHKHVWGPVAADGFSSCRCGKRIQGGLDLQPVIVRWKR